MKRSIKFNRMIILAVMIMIGMVSLGKQNSLANSWAVFDNGQAQIRTPLHLDLDLSSSVARLGDQIALQLTLHNPQSNPVAPQVTIALPTILRPHLDQLASGISINTQVNRLSWQPVVSGEGMAQTTIVLTVASLMVEQPEQTITAVLHQDHVQSSTNIVLWAGAMPVGQPQITPLRASVGQPVQFTAELAGSGPFTQIWHSGDGRSISAENPVLIYPQTGTYEVELQVANPLGTHTSREQIVIVPEPVSFFEVDDTTPALGQTIQFNSQSGGQAPLYHVWDFGDGTLSTLANPTHQYRTPGPHEVQLTVRNAFGQAQNRLSLVVGERPVADMEISPNAKAGELVTGQAYISENTDQILWEMGDGQVYEGETIQHRYRRAGEMTVRMTARNLYGDHVISQTVSIEPGRSDIYLPLLLSSDTPLTTTQVITPSSLIDAPSTIAFVPIEGEIVLDPNAEIDALPSADQLLWYINEARRQAGVSEVVLETLLSTAAKQHTDDMASNSLNSHTGSDGSPPYERLARVGYRSGGYAGETTAWGFRYGREAVQFWLESPPHRAILLNPLATEVGVAQTTNYDSLNIWYWTAEFASRYGSIEAQLLEEGVRLVYPAPTGTFAFGDTVLFRWVWPLKLPANGHFALYFNTDAGEYQIARVTEVADIDSLQGTPQEGQVYVYSTLVNDLTQQTGTYGWQVRLEDVAGNLLSKSAPRPLVITGTLPTVTPLPTPTLPLPPPDTPSPTATPTTPFAAPPPKATPTPLPLITPVPTAKPTLLPPPTSTIP